MTSNPWQPPAGWDQPPGRDRIEPTPLEGPWTVGRVLQAMGRAIRRQPLGVLLAVFVIPGIWMVPTTIVHSRLVPETEHAFGPGRSLVSVAVSLGSTAWNSVWFAGELCAAIAAVRGEAIRWRNFVSGLSRAPQLFLSSVLVTLPFELIGMLPLAVPSGEVFSLFDAIFLPLTVFLSARTCLWAPLLADARRPLWEGLAESWVMTWGSMSKLIVLAGLLLTATVPVLIVNAAFADELHVTFAVGSGLYLLALAALYELIHLRPVPHEPGAEAPVSASPNPEP